MQFLHLTPLHAKHWSDSCLSALHVLDQQTTLDNDLNSYTAIQQRAHLDSLATQIPPIIYEDLDGMQYECKVRDLSVQTDKLEYLDGSTVYSCLYRLTIEQVFTS